MANKTKDVTLVAEVLGLSTSGVDLVLDSVKQGDPTPNRSQPNEGGVIYGCISTENENTFDQLFVSGPILPHVTDIHFKEILGSKANVQSTYSKGVRDILKDVASTGYPLFFKKGDTWYLHRWAILHVIQYMENHKDHSRLTKLINAFKNITEPGAVLGPTVTHTHHARILQWVVGSYLRAVHQEYGRNKPPQIIDGWVEATLEQAAAYHAMPSNETVPFMGSAWAPVVPDFDVRAKIHAVHIYDKKVELKPVVTAGNGTVTPVDISAVGLMERYETLHAEIQADQIALNKKIDGLLVITKELEAERASMWPQDSDRPAVVVKDTNS